MIWQGCHDLDNKEIYINADNQDGTSETYIGTDGHEISHYKDDVSGEGNGREKVAERFV